MTKRRLEAHLSILLLLTLLVLALTYPVAAEVVRGSALPGPRDFDEFEYTWLLWWYAESLVHQGRNPASLPFYYPMETEQPLVSVTPLGWLLPIPLVLLFGPVRAYVLYWLASFVLCGYSAYLLGLWLTRSRPAAWVGAVIFAFYPGRMLHALGHMGDMLIFMFPLYALFLMKLARHPSRSNSVRLIVTTVVGVLIDFRHIGLFYIPFTAVFLTYTLLAAPRTVLSPRFARQAVIAGTTAFLLSLPFFGPFLLQSLGGGLAHLKEGGLIASSADILSFILPPMTHPLLGKVPYLDRLMKAVWTESLYIETCLYLGVTASVLALVALRSCGRRAWLGGAVILIGAALALGPVLKVGGKRLEDAPLPYVYLSRLPFYEWVRIPARLDMLIKLALAMLAAGGTRVLGRRRGAQGRTWLTTGIVLLVLFEYLTFFPYPTAELKASPFLEGLADDGEEYGILHLASHEYAMYLQTLHRHPMVEGHIHRWPPGGSEWALQLHGLAVYPPQFEKQYYDILDEKLPYGRDGTEVLTAAFDPDPARILARAGIRFVVFDRKGPWTEDDEALYAAQLEDSLGKPVHRDDRLTIYQVGPFPTAAPTLLPLSGWYALEGGEQELWRWIDKQADVDIEGVAAGTYRLKLAVRPAFEPQHLEVAVGGRNLGRYPLTGRREYITPPFHLDGGTTRLSLSLTEGCHVPHNSLEGNFDRRCLGAAIHELRLFPALAEPFRFGQVIELLGYQVARGKGADPSLYVDLFWQPTGAIERDYTVFVHLVDGEDRIVSQDDRRLTTRWNEPLPFTGQGEGVRTFHRLELPPTLELRELSIKLGIYEVASMERLPLQADTSGENTVVLPGDQPNGYPSG